MTIRYIPLYDRRLIQYWRDADAGLWRAQVLHWDGHHDHSIKPIDATDRASILQKIFRSELVDATLINGDELTGFERKVLISIDV